MPEIDVTAKSAEWNEGHRAADLGESEYDVPYDRCTERSQWREWLAGYHFQEDYDVIPDSPAGPTV